MAEAETESKKTQEEPSNGSHDEIAVFTTLL
jgi:hypothetical protein